MCKSNISIDDIDTYLSEVKAAISSNRYRIELNSRRRGNLDLFTNYVIDETKTKEILLNLTANDFLKYCKMNIITA